MSRLEALLRWVPLDWQLNHLEYDTKRYIEKAQELYVTSTGTFLKLDGLENQTSPYSSSAIDIAVNLLSPLNEIRVLLAGAGMRCFIDVEYGDNIMTSFQAPYLVARLEQLKHGPRGTNYAVTIVDIDTLTLEFVKKMDSIELPKWLLERYPELRNVWQDYQKAFAANPEETKVATYYNRHIAGITSAEKLPLPETWKQRIDEGRVQFLQGDLANADISRFGRFDLAIATNVYDYFRGRAGKRLATYNLARNLKRGGFLVLDDDPICPNIDAIGSRFLDYFGLAVVHSYQRERPYGKSRHSLFILQKV